MSYDTDHGSISDIPEPVRSYLRGFQVAIDSQNVDGILQYYETDWNKMTERYFKTSPWPHWKVVEELSGHDGVFILLYKGIFGARVQNAGQKNDLRNPNSK
jgi:translation initiation factor 3 subunit L